MTLRWRGYSEASESKSATQADFTAGLTVGQRLNLRLREEIQDFRWVKDEVRREWTHLQAANLAPDCVYNLFCFARFEENLISGSITNVKKPFPFNFALH